MKEEYDQLLKSGMFWVFFPDMTGYWVEDEPDFIEFYVTHR